MNKELEIDVFGENKKHTILCEYWYERGYRATEHPRNEYEFLTPSEPDEIEINKAYLVFGNQKREIVPNYHLENYLEEEILAYENGYRD